MSVVFVPAVLVRRVASQATHRDCKVPLLTIRPSPASQLRILAVCVLARNSALDVIAEGIKVFPRAGHRRSCRGGDLAKETYRTHQRGYSEIYHHHTVVI
jgi:hypothetical protein